MLLKDLKELLKLLKSSGVTEYVTSDLSVKLDLSASESKASSKKPLPDTQIEEEPVNPDDILFYSAAAPAATSKD